MLSSLTRSTGVDSWRCSSASRRLASEMSEISRSSRLHVVLDHGEQARMALLRLGQRQRLDRGAQRGQRILQFMRDIGGEALDRLDAAVERVGHVAQRAGQMPDLVAAPGEIRNLDAIADAPAHPLRAVGKPAHRPGDGAREQNRQHDHYTGGDKKHLQDRKPLGFNHIVDIGALGGEQQHAAHRAEPLHRNGDRDDHLAAVVDAHDARFLSVKRLRDFRIALAVLRAEFAVERQVAAAEPFAHGIPLPLEEARLLMRRRAAGRTAGCRRGHTDCGCRAAARRRGHRCGRGCWSARSDAAAPAPRAPD